jgi:DHA2 family multidrug resistance protein
VIGSAVNLFRDSVRQRLADLTSYFLSHGVSDIATAHHKAIIALGNIVRRQALIMGYADTFAALAVLLVMAAACLLLTRPAGANDAPAH